jgi:hypothetical protein
MTRLPSHPAPSGLKFNALRLYNLSFLREVSSPGLAAEEGGTSASIKEQVLTLGNVLNVDLRAAVSLGQNAISSVSNRVSDYFAKGSPLSPQ